MSDKLRPCPLCGYKARFGTTVNDFKFGVYVMCCRKSCRLKGRIYATRIKAAAAWNTRPIENALVEALKALRDDCVDLNEYWNGGNGSAVDACQHTCEVSETMLKAIDAALCGTGVEP